ncbi:cell adhesion molecule Dscam2 [Anabrus simplex]|uniref:cell adhesion molecule Dscam2 n=1 Tax=Anabrus simplex TaxID=316456 RepID=UPI0035A3D507
MASSDKIERGIRTVSRCDARRGVAGCDRPRFVRAVVEMGKGKELGYELKQTVVNIVLTRYTITKVGDLVKTSHATVQYVVRTEGLYDTQGPSFVSEPPPKVEFTNSSGGRVDCAARGNPAPSVEWVGADNAVVASIPAIRLVLGNGSVYFPPFEAEAFRQDVHRAIYRCVVSNSVGTIVSRDVMVRAVVNQRYEPEVQSPGGFLGNNVIIRCSVPSFVKDHVTVTSWLQEPAFNIYPSTVSDGKYHMLPSGELMILNITRGDALRTYRCRTHHQLTQEAVVSSNVGRIQLTDIRGTVPPILNEKLVMLTARVDDTVVVPCVAYANPRPRYRWFFRQKTHETPLDEAERYLVRDGTLVIPNVKESDAGAYFCNASNKEGSEVLELQLSVVAPLQVHVHPSRQTVDLGKSADLTCTATGFPQGSMSWLKDGQPLRTGARVRLLTRDHVHVVSVAKEDRGMYQCFVKNEAEMAQGVAELRLGEVYPQLAYKFIEQTMQPGPSVSLKCSASGNPTPQISWTLDGFPLPQNERLMIGQYVTVFGDVISHVNISSVKPEDSGEYECVAENRAGKATHNARLNVYGLPYVRLMPPIAAVAGKELLIKCPVAGYPIDTVLWEKDGIRLPTNIRQRVTNGTLIVDNVQRESDQGSYTCVARNKQNITSQRTVDVRVLVPPKITPFSFARDLNVGDRTSIQCVVVTGDLPLSFTWLKDNTSTSTPPMDINIRQYDDFTSALSIGSITWAHSGNYTCHVANDAATVTHTAQLQVNVPPRIAPFYFEDGVTEGMRTQLMCATSQGDQPYNITWLKDSRLLGPADDDWITIKEYEHVSSILTINSVTSSHSGNYTCVVGNRAGSVTYTAHLSVMVPPRWVVEPADQSVVLGQPVTLHCQVDGFPKPAVIWKQAIGNQPGEYRELGYRSERIQSLENGSLIIPRVSEEHEGYFLCQAGNGIGAGLSKVIRLTVYAGPEFKIRSRQETVRKGELVHLRCEAEGDQPMDLTWKAKGSRIDPGYDIRYIIKTTPLSHGVMSELSIMEASHLDRGEYTCFASNAYGQDHTTIQLLVQEPPNFPRNLHVAEQTSRSILLSWSPSGGDTPVTSYILQYKEARDVWHEHNPQKVVGGDKSVMLVTGLRPATTYHFRLYAENQLGMSAPSDVLHGTTESEVPSGAPQQVAVEPMGAQQLRITWQAPDRELWNGELLGYSIGFRKSGPISEKEPYNFTRVAVIGDLPGDFRLTGLEKFTKYSIVVQAFNSKGDGPTSEPVITETLEDVPSAPPQDVECTALSSQNMQVSWKPPPLNQIHGIIQGYKLFFEPAEEWYEPVIRDKKVTTALTTVLHGLQPYTNYSLQVLAFTRVGDGAAGPVVYCMTEETVPEAPEKVKAVVSSEDAVVISWLPPRRPNGILTKYTVYIRVLENGQERKIIKGTLPSQQLHYDAVGLKKRESYEAWVTASTKVGQGLSTPVIQLTPNPSESLPAAIISFGQLVIVPWKVDVKLLCLCVGIPRPTTEWKMGDLKLHSQHRMEITAENTLIIQNVQRSNEGNYSCHARNNLGSDQIVYSLQVQVPPTPPLLLATAVTHSSVQLQWKQGDNGGAAVRGFLLSYRRDSGEWEEISVDRRATTYLLDGLLCGTRYQFQLSAFNKIGSGVASRIETATTKGGKPIVPSASHFLQVNKTSVILFLSTWQDGGCPILYFIIEYKKGNSDWMQVASNVLPQPRFPISDLAPASHYALRVTAHNNAGSTQGEYKFSTLNLAGGQHLPDAGNIENADESPFYLDSHVVVPSSISLVAVVLALAGVCFCLRRKPETEDMSLHESQTAAALDNKQNMEQREQYYATVRKPLQSPMRDVSGLERIPEYSEDIYPYATFHLPEHESMAANPQIRQTYTYEPRAAEAMQIKQTETDHYSKVRPRQRRKSKSFKSESEEYDTLGSDSDTEQGTSSRTESSNHLDDPGPGTSRAGTGIHRPVHHNFPYHTHESSTSTEPSPISERKSFPRHGKLRITPRLLSYLPGFPLSNIQLYDKSQGQNILLHTLSGTNNQRVHGLGIMRGNFGNGRMLRKVPTAETAFVLGRKIEPPSGFSDGHELSEAECDIDSMKKLRLGIIKNSLNIFGPSSGNQDFTIAV